MLLAEVTQSSMLWTAISVFFMVIYLIMFVSVVIDLFRNPDLGGVATALWVLFLLVFPVLSLLLYVIFYGPGMATRSSRRAEQVQAAQNQYIRDVAGTSRAREIEHAKELLDAGTITQSEYETLKDKALA